MLYARQYGSFPQDLVGSLTGLTEGDRFPVAGTVRYADDISERAAAAARQARQERDGQRRRRHLKLTHPPRDQHLRPRGRLGRRRE